MTPLPPVLDERVIRQCNARTPDLVGRWTEQARACSIDVRTAVDTAESVNRVIDECLAPHTIGQSILNAGALEARYGLGERLAARQIKVLPWGGPHCREAAFHCEASVTDCRAGLADTGGILVWSDVTFGRSSTLVVPVHIVLLPVERILPDLVDGLALAQSQQNFPSNIVVINGPSKTADIEMKLITGVHGPKFLYVILIHPA